MFRRVFRARAHIGRIRSVVCRPHAQRHLSHVHAAKHPSSTSPRLKLVKDPWCVKSVSHDHPLFFKHVQHVPTQYESFVSLNVQLSAVVARQLLNPPPADARPSESLPLAHQGESGVERCFWCRVAGVRCWSPLPRKCVLGLGRTNHGGSGPR